MPSPAAEVFEAVVGLAGIDDEAGGLHNPRVTAWVVQDEGLRALIDTELGVAFAGDRLVRDAFVFAELLGHVEPHDPAGLQAHEIAFRADYDLGPVQRPEPRAVLERAEDVVLFRERIHIDLVEHPLGGGISGAVGVVQPDRVVDPGGDVVDDRMAADQEDLGVPLAVDVVKAHELGVGIIVRKLGRD